MYARYICTNVFAWDQRIQKNYGVGERQLRFFTLDNCSVRVFPLYLSLNWFNKKGMHVTYVQCVSFVVSCGTHHATCFKMGTRGHKKWSKSEKVKIFYP